MSRRTWRESRRYVLPPLGAALVLLPRHRRSALTLAGAAGLVALFFRDPERVLEPEAGILYSAADGFVAAVEDPVADVDMPGEKGLRISTFLSIHNVHVNRSPVAATVTGLEPVLGGFAPALFGRAQDNSRNRISLTGPEGPVTVVQIAGSIARTIRCWVKVGDSVAAGGRLGIIHFGSRTDVVVPSGSAHPLVKVGDRVRAGVSPLARYVEG